jgi:hypothetical protein
VKILYIPQLSMRSYVDSRWLVSSASQVVRMLAYKLCLPDDWKWTFLLPELDQLDADWQDVFVADRSVNIVHAKWMDDVRKNRFFVPYDTIEHVYREHKPDVVILETPEHAFVLRHIAQVTGVEPRLVSFFVHVEDRISPTWRRQIEGFNSSHYAAFQSDRERRLWIKYHASPGMGINEYELKRKSRVWPGMFSPEEGERARSTPQLMFAREPEHPTIFFISRLSDQQRTRYPEFVEAVRLMNERNADEIRVWFANPNEAMDWSQVRLLPGYEQHPFGDRTLRREQYLTLLGMSHVVPILYANKSGGLCEAVVARNSLVTVPENGTLFSTVEDPSDPEQIAKALELAFEMHEQPDVLDEQIEFVLSQHGVERNIDVVRETINGE